MRHSEVAKAFVRGEKATGSRMFTNGKTIWSHGEHFTIAKRISNGYLFNKEEYSKSTARHKRYVYRALPENQVIEVYIKEIPLPIYTLTRNMEELKSLITKFERARTKKEYYEGLILKVIENNKKIKTALEEGIIEKENNNLNTPVTITEPENIEIVKAKIHAILL